jgi:hypothetical protein
MPSQSRREGQFGDFVELIEELDAATDGIGASVGLRHTRQL